METRTRTSTAPPMASQSNYGGYSFATIVQRLRLAQLVAIALQLATLYMDHERIGLRTLLPMAFLLLNIAHTGRRWFLSVDGRQDFMQIADEHSMGLKMQYVAALLGSIILATSAHFMLSALPSTLTGLIYHLADYASIVTAGLATAAEIFEGTKMRGGNLKMR